ncbi:MAG: integrase arm-type DNA-binding domain-containing protein [Methylovirgula sp.]|nr:integrase arm-type DNA-binding domain-containing protein [Methylovirgula sp.]
MLTAKRIATLTKPGRYGDGHGLYLQITKAGVRSWLFRYRRDGRERAMGLGPSHVVGLAAARERARAARLQLLDGIDPLEAKKAGRAARALAAAKALTFADAAEQYFAQHERKWRNAKHRAQFLSTLKTYAFPKIGKLPLGEIDTGLILKAIEPIWLTKTETANRVRGRIEAVLDWATVRGYRTGDNPARWRGHLENVLPARAQVQKPKHHAALPYVELPAFICDLAGRQGTAARALEFTIATAARTGETIGATWPEIDFDAKTWTVPAGRMKASKEHRVPLSDRALAILKALPREAGNDFIFIGPTKGHGFSNMAMSKLLQRMGRDEITVHGFRSTFMDWAHEQTAFPKVTIDMALAHVVGDKVEAAYRRGDLFEKRCALMSAWAKYLYAPAPEGEVVPLRRAP